MLKEHQIPQEIANNNNIITIQREGETSNLILEESDSSTPPFLFDFLRDMIIKGYRGYRLGVRSISMICYADNATLVAETGPNY